MKNRKTIIPGFGRIIALFVTSIVSMFVCCKNKPLQHAGPTAPEQFAALQEQVQAAGKSGDKHARLQAALQMKRLLNDAPDAVEFTAQAYDEVQDSLDALKMLNLFADLGQTDAGLLHGKVKRFSGLQKLPQFKSILEHFARNETAVSRAIAAFTLQDPGILAEDIDYDPATNSFLITSVLEKKIIRVTAEGQSTDFAKSPSQWPMLAIKIDTRHNLVWATEVAVNGFTSVPKSDWGRSAILCYDLHTGALRKRIEGPAHTALGDMALSQDGDPIVCDGDGGGVYRIVNDQLDSINRRDFISPQTPVMLPDQERVLIPDYVRGIGILDLRNGLVTWLSETAGTKVALNGIDGLYFDRGNLLITQNGASPECVMRLFPDTAFTRVDSVQVIERATPTLGDPTHGVVVNGFFYYIANSGWSALDEHGDLKPGTKLTPPQIMRFAL